MDTIFRVAEIFRSLQGEGPSIGTPATFLRLQGCAVGCSWCDTKFSWSLGGGKSLTLAQIEERVGGDQLLVVTGGEPLVHPGIHELLEWADGAFPNVEVETSGIAPPVHIAHAGAITFNWSPKLPRVTERAHETWAHAQSFNRAVGVCKVVVRDAEDFSDAVIHLRAYKVPTSRVVIMPQGVESADLDERMRVLAPLCVDHGYRLSPRLHIQLWGKERGQ